MKTKSHSSDGVCEFKSLVLEEKVIRMKKVPALSQVPISEEFQ